MEHVIKRGERTLKVTFYCDHPKLEDNICPLRWGDCGECRHCKVETSAKDMLFLLNSTKEE